VASCFSVLNLKKNFAFLDDDVMSFLEALGPSGLDLAIRSMRPEMAGPSSVTLMIKFLELVLYQIKRVDKFESIHSFLALFLQVKMFVFQFSMVYRFVIRFLCIDLGAS